MKILLIVSSYAPNTGGLQTVTRQLARELHARGHRVQVLANRYPRTLKSEEVIDDILVWRWHFLLPRLQQLSAWRLDLFLAGLVYFPLTLARLILLVVRKRPDAVNLHFVGAPAPFVFVARKLVRFRLIVSLHGDDVEGRSQRAWLDRRVFDRLMHVADAVTACSQHLLNQALAVVANTSAARVIYNGIEQPEVRANGTAKGILAAGRMVPKKGFDVLLRAHATDPKHPLTLIGDGPERERLGQVAKNLGMNGEVQFAGDLDHARVLERMADCEMVVIPSLQEPFGLVALEAMALGKPVIASRVGGLPEILADADALLVKAGDENDLARAIRTVRERLSGEPSFGRRNLERAAYFSLARMTDSYLEAYRG